MIEIELQFENKFLENLQHQIEIKKIEQFKNNIPTFSEQLHEANLAVQEIREKFNEIRRRESYRRVIDQLDDIPKN